MFRDMGWRVITMKYGRRMEQAFARPGGVRVAAAAVAACRGVGVRTPGISSPRH